MKELLKNLGVVILLLGVVCFVVYHFAVQQNALLLVGALLEVIGIVVYIVVNKRID